MRIHLRVLLAGLALLTPAGRGFSQTVPTRTMVFNVAVEPKSGPPITGLQQSDFSFVDNKSVQPIISFKAVTAGQEPVQTIVLVDAVNSPYETVAYEREQVEKFLKAGDGKLALPAKVAILNDTGVQMQQGFSRDGNGMADALEHAQIGLREITRSSGYWGASERLDLSLKAINQLIAYARTLPGRKAILWVSPGWPLLSSVRTDLDAKQQKQVFGNIVAISTAMREANMTLYNINPLGVQESLARTDYYQTFLRGISKPEQTDLGDLGLQVLAIQSGGLALESSSDVAGGLRRCTEELGSWYEIGITAPAAEHANEYHHVEVRVDRPGLTARTRDGYYAQP